MRCSLVAVIFSTLLFTSGVSQAGGQYSYSIGLGYSNNIGYGYKQGYGNRRNYGHGRRHGYRHCFGW